MQISESTTEQQRKRDDDLTMSGYFIITSFQASAGAILRSCSEQCRAPILYERAKTCSLPCLSSQKSKPSFRPSSLANTSPLQASYRFLHAETSLKIPPPLQPCPPPLFRSVHARCQHIPFHGPHTLVRVLFPCIHLYPHQHCLARTSPGSSSLPQT